MLQDLIGKEEVLHITDQLVEELDPNSDEDSAIMANGLHLYRQGFVYNVFVEEEVLEGTVADEGNVYSVQIPLSHAHDCLCTCHQPDYCEHETAILFYAAASFGLVGEVMKRFKNKGKPDLPKLQTAKQLLQSSIFEEQDYNSWIAYFERDFDTFLKDQSRYPFRQSYLLINVYEDLYRKITRKAPRTVVLRELFELNAALFCFQKLIDLAEDLETRRTHSYYKPASIAQRFVEEMEIIINKLSTETIPLTYDDLLAATGRHVHTLFFSYSVYIQERFFLYRHIWGELLNRSPWIEEETKRIEEELQPMNQQLALAHLSFLKKQDEEAIQHLETQSYLLVGLYFYWIDELIARLDWERTIHWLSFTYQKLKHYVQEEENVYIKRDLVRLFLTSYASFAEQKDEQASYEMIIQELLPYSFYEYEQYLLSKKQYRTWTELQLFMGFETLDTIRETMKEVEKEDQEAVLPLYHQAVMKSIQMKNRQSYKIAVRYLKRLRILYKKLKRTSEWDTYIRILSQTFSRLRAFQEELRKGKLIDEDR